VLLSYSFTCDSFVSSYRLFAVYPRH